MARFSDLITGERRGYAPMYRAARILAERGVFDPGEITSDDEGWLEVSNDVGKHDLLSLPFVDGLYEDCYYEKRDNGYLFTYDKDDKLFVQLVHGIRDGKLPALGVVDLAVRKSGTVFVIYHNGAMIFGSRHE